MIQKCRIYCYETQEMIVARDYRELAELFVGLDADDSLYSNQMQSTGLFDKKGFQKGHKHYYWRGKMNNTIENVKITETFLGREDHGFLTCYLTVMGDGFGVSIGGYCLDKYDENKRKRVAYHKGFELIDRILEVVGVSTWEDIPGKHIRIESNGPGCRVTKIGNLIKEDWLDFDTFLKEETDE